MHHCGLGLVRCMQCKKNVHWLYICQYNMAWHSAYPHNRHYTHRKQWYEGTFVDPVKQGLPKIFLSQVNHTTNSVTKPTAPSSPYIPRLVPIACGFCNETFIAVYEYSLQCECGYEYAIGSYNVSQRYCSMPKCLNREEGNAEAGKDNQIHTWINCSFPLFCLLLRCKTFTICCKTFLRTGRDIAQCIHIEMSYF